MTSLHQKVSFQKSRAFVSKAEARETKKTGRRGAQKTSKNLQCQIFDVFFEMRRFSSQSKNAIFLPKVFLESAFWTFFFVQNGPSQKSFVKLCFF